MTSRDQAVIHALRSDLAHQIARHVRRNAQTQSAAAKQLAIPQPTLSRIMRGQVEALSLELLLRVAVRAGLPVVLQTGKDPTEAGAYVSGITASRHERPRSLLAEEARMAVNDRDRALTPGQRLEAQLRHSELITELHRAGSAQLTPRARSRG
jgi:predicted XRE-type DNA-binding protein